MCFRYFDFKSFKEVDVLSFRELLILTKVARLKEVDRQYALHEQAFLNLAVQSTDSSGKRYKFNNFNKFFNYTKAYNTALGIKQKKKSTAEAARMDSLLRRLKEIKEERREKDGL